MLRHLFTVAASLTVTACVMQPQPGYWGTPASPYAQTYPPYPYTQEWNSAPAPRVPYSPPRPAYYSPQQVSYEPQPVSYQSQPASSMSPPASYATRPAAVAPETPPRPDGDDAAEPATPHSAFADETVDYGIPPTNTLHLHDFDAPTPTHVEGAHTVTTVELQSMLASDRPPLLIDVIGGPQTVSLPNAIWLRDAGVGRHLDDDIQAWLDLHLSRLTDRDKSRPVVFFCASRMCWLAHNATLRALDLGYTNVYWYRGGRDSWQAAGLPMSRVAPPPVDD